MVFHICSYLPSLEYIRVIKNLSMIKRVLGFYVYFIQLLNFHLKNLQFLDSFNVNYYPKKPFEINHTLYFLIFIIFNYFSFASNYYYCYINYYCFFSNFYFRIFIITIITIIGCLRPICQNFFTLF